MYYIYKMSICILVLQINSVVVYPVAKGFKQGIMSPQVLVHPLLASVHGTIQTNKRHVVH